VSSFTDNPPPIVTWDIIRGLRAINPEGDEMLSKVVAAANAIGPPYGVDPVEALILGSKFLQRSLLFFFNAHRFIDSPPVMQAICNLRDIYKSDQRTLVMLGTAITLPAELVQDVLMIDEPLPDEQRIKDLIKGIYNEARKSVPALPELDEKTIHDSTAALAGLALFPAEQTCAMSINVTTNQVDVSQMWERKRGMINQTPGIEMLEDATLPRFDAIGGLDAAKRFGSCLFNGANPPRVVVWIDEIEKMFAGLGSGGVGDTSGVSQDQLGVMLREQEFNNWAGLIAVGPPGACKSHYARALGPTHGVPTAMLDLGAMKDSLVGSSEQRVRAALKVIKAVAGKGGAFFVATCNDLTVLPPELRRRYKYGIWFFDLPTKEEREMIWKICLKQFDLEGKAAKHTFDDSGWTGAEIRNVCELAWRLGQPIDEARKNIVPVSVSDADRIDRLRKAAAGKFLSASYAGPYRATPLAEVQSARKIYGD
jgi:hypothetical protein